MRSRYVQKTGRGDDVLLDENLLEYTNDRPLFILPHSLLMLHTSVSNDTMVLSKNNIMDYSLLVGMDDSTNELVVGIIGTRRWRRAPRPRAPTMCGYAPAPPAARLHSHVHLGQAAGNVGEIQRHSRRHRQVAHRFVAGAVCEALPRRHGPLLSDGAGPMERPRGRHDCELRDGADGAVGVGRQYRVLPALSAARLRGATVRGVAGRRGSGAVRQGKV